MLSDTNLKELEFKVNAEIKNLDVWFCHNE